MQFKSILFATVILVVTTAGCAFFTPERVAAIHRSAATALQLAYENGGTALVAAKINQMVADGLITDVQAAQLKAAAANGYQAFVTRLKELSEKLE